MLKYFINILFLLLPVAVLAQDLEEDEPQRKVVADSSHQLRLGFDISKLVSNSLQDTRNSYEFELDYYWKKGVYWVAEAGWGNATLDYSYLSYKSSNSFFKIGINKSLLERLSQKDWDMAFIGLRYGMGLVQRGSANYTITDSTWGQVSGSVPATGLTAHWIGLTGGVRVELLKGMFIGWNVRGKFLLNSKKFVELPPYYIAGYGRGEKNTVFDFNVYLCYAIRWKKQARHKE